MDLWVFQGIFGVKGGSITYLQILALILEGKKRGTTSGDTSLPLRTFPHESNTYVFTKTLFLLGPFRRALLIEREKKEEKSNCYTPIQLLFSL